jgi:pyruvate/2-oxoglutarate dehydrogenase complex dihydrolipoamide dehydrogenase (E3) component
LLVLGGGAVGCELALCFARFGSRVTLIEALPRLLAREDPEASDEVARRFLDEGIEILTNCEAVRVESDEGEAAGGKAVVCRVGDVERRFTCDEILCALGRVANTEDYGLERLGLRLSGDGALHVDQCMRTSHPDIFACGDVAGSPQYTHAAAHGAWHATLNALFGGLRAFRVDFSLVPRATFTDPEIASVGLSEAEALERSIACEVIRFDLGELDRALIDGVPRGFVKALTVPGRDRLLGAVIVGERAADLIVEFTLAMKHGIGLRGLLSTLHAYPTFSEAARHAAGQWRTAHAPQRLLQLSERFLAWRRGA